MCRALLSLISNISHGSHSWLGEDQQPTQWAVRPAPPSPFRRSSSTDPPRVRRAEGSRQPCGLEELGDKRGASDPQRQRIRPWRSRAPCACRRPGAGPHTTQNNADACAEGSPSLEGKGRGQPGDVAVARSRELADARFHRPSFKSACFRPGSTRRLRTVGWGSPRPR